MTPHRRPPLRNSPTALFLAALCLFASHTGHAAPTPAPESERKATPQPDGDRLVRLLKKIADAGVLLDPERMAAELGIAMTFETKPSEWQSKGCAAGGEYKTFLVTNGKAGPSWFKSGPEGVRDMEVPAFTINPKYVAGEPQMGFGLYRTVRCRSPGYTNIESSLSFSNLSAFSCLTPDRLQRLIGTKYQMATDGVSLSSYSPPATDAYGVSLEFTFRAGAPCAVGASIRLESRSGFREQRAFVKWRACLDKAKADYCTAHPGLTSSDRGALQSHEFGACDDQQIYIGREPPGGGPPPSWPEFKPMSDNPCDD